jgi:hypothetical protein
MVRRTHTLGTSILSAHHRTRTNTNPNGTEANAVGILERACVVRESKHFRRIMSCSLWPSSRAMAAPTPLTGHRAKLPPGTFTSYPCWPSTEAKRCCQAERSGEGEFAGLPQLRQSNSHARRRSSSLAQGRSGISPNYDTTQHAHAQKKAMRSGQAERSGEGGLGGFPRLRRLNSHARRRRPSRAQRPSQALRKGGFGGLPQLRQFNSHARRRSPSLG